MISRSFAVAVLVALYISSFLSAEAYAQVDSQNITVSGIVFDKDSITPMPFAYAVNKNSSTGTLTDEKGKFSLMIHPGDTLSFSYLGYSVTNIYTQTLKDSVRNSSLRVKVILKPRTTELRSVIIATHSFTKEEKEYYAQKIGEYERGISSPLASPISAMYYSWSKKGKELQKLSVLYQQLLVDEVKESRLSAEKIRAITGDEKLDVKDFLNNCYLPEQFIVSASDYDLFLAVKRYYREYMELYNKKK